MGKKKDKGKHESVQPPIREYTSAPKVELVDGKFANVGGPSRVQLICLTLAWAKHTKVIRLSVGDGEISVKCPKGWVEGWLLCHPGIGGAAGDRRLRELVTAGSVEKRLVVRGPETVVEYRLLGKADR